ncbi:M56 family metallopeptidase [Phenylobacterium sp.]|uniref:M56 family metallopeptidase n=1 Tax=Phenylobacterium sp. TaxID=1871053 RepID=UPI002BBC94BA|nr:M56 family metallopeptidase [Phenylobacterium sp.]HLZ76403.1 M56 family metallopeptidase [Phenylobacterium sp.]
MSEALALLLRVNLAIAGAVALAMLLRRPARRLFGARVAYQLWALVPLAVAAMLAPTRIITLAAPKAAVAQRGLAAAFDYAPSLPAPSGPDLSAILMVLWIAGAAAALAHLAWRQAQFSRAVRAGRAGPAVVGVLRPRVVTPRDFTGRYTPREQRVVLAHEETHIARQDSRINAAVALARCLNWFNPLVHVLAHYLRIDQELACDAQVVAAHPAARRAYAEAMLKTQLAARPLPIGCYWPAQAAHPLAERIGLLSRRTPSRAARALGAASIAALTLGVAWTAWATRPAQVVFAATPAAQPAPVTAEQQPPAPPPQVSTPAARPAPRPQPLQLVSMPPEPTEAFETARDPAAYGFTRVTDAPPIVAVEPHLLAPGEFGPRRVHAIAGWSSVEPGSAVRVYATMQDPDGHALVTDLTAFGSQSWYRLGYIERDNSRFKLFTKVNQHGDRLTVTAGLNESLHPMVSGSIDLASGETGTIRLPSGLTVTVTPTLRAETPEEIAEGQRTGGRGFVNVLRMPAPT